MKHIFRQSVLLILFITVSVICSAQFPFSKDIKRIVFLGNSITYNGAYINYIETYFVQQYPKHKLEFINVGLPSETVSGLSETGHAEGKFPRPDLHERLQRVIDLTNPDLVFACYGMNDGIYLPFDNNRFEAYKNGINWLNKKLIENGVKRIIFITPPVHDDKKLRTKGYNKVLDTYAGWLVNSRKLKKWEVIDLHTPLTKYIVSGIKKDSTFRLANDEVHPTAEGHWVMAKIILQGLKQKVNNDLASTLKRTMYDEELLKLVSERQNIMKDAWLNAAGHKRPGMTKGLTLDEANKKYEEIQFQIDKMLLKTNSENKQN